MPCLGFYGGSGSHVPKLVLTFLFSAFSHELPSLFCQNSEKLEVPRLFSSPSGEALGDVCRNNVIFPVVWDFGPSVAGLERFIGATSAEFFTNQHFYHLKTAVETVSSCWLLVVGHGLISWCSVCAGLCVPAALSEGCPSSAGVCAVQQPLSSLPSLGDPDMR